MKNLPGWGQARVSVWQNEGESFGNQYQLINILHWLQTKLTRKQYYISILEMRSPLCAVSSIGVYININRACGIHFKISAAGILKAISRNYCVLSIGTRRVSIGALERNAKLVSYLHYWRGNSILLRLGVCFSSSAVSIGMRGAVIEGAS